MCYLIFVKLLTRSPIPAFSTSYSSMIQSLDNELSYWSIRINNFRQYISKMTLVMSFLVCHKEQFWLCYSSWFPLMTFQLHVSNKVWLYDDVILYSYIYTEEDYHNLQIHLDSGGLISGRCHLIQENVNSWG